MTEQNYLGYNVVLLDTLKTILSVCRDSSIDVIILKGAALLEDLYPDLNTRKLSDIDLLVKENNLRQIQDILKSLGFKPLKKSRTSFIKKDTLSVIIDLHFVLKHLSALSIDEIWDNARKVHIAQTNTLVLSHEHNLIYLSTHLIFSHEGIADKWLIDIDLYIKKYLAEIDWGLLETETYKNNLQLPLYYLFTKIKKKYQTPFPPQFLNKLKPISEKTFSTRFYRKIIYHEKNIPFIEYLLPVLSKKGIIKKLQFILYICFPPIDDMKKRYNTDNFLYIALLYILRPIILIIKGLIALISLLSS